VDELKVFTDIAYHPFFWWLYT